MHATYPEDKFVVRRDKYIFKYKKRKYGLLGRNNVAMQVNATRTWKNVEMRGLNMELHEYR